jgi:hypothetical protein
LVKYACFLKKEKGMALILEDWERMRGSSNVSSVFMYSNVKTPNTAIGGISGGADKLRWPTDIGVDGAERTFKNSRVLP